jgi:hypothetical protein
MYIKGLLPNTRFHIAISSNIHPFPYLFSHSKNKNATYYFNMCFKIQIQLVFSIHVYHFILTMSCTKLVARECFVGIDIPCRKNINYNW